MTTTKPRGEDREDRVLVTGGRDYADRDAVFIALDALYASMPNIIIIHGACCRYERATELRGADRWAQEWAQSREVPYIGVPAQWKQYGKAAGMTRNQAMYDRFVPTSVVAFPGGDGTANAVSIARKLGLVVWEPFGPGLTASPNIRRRPIRTV